MANSQTMQPYKLQSAEEFTTQMMNQQLQATVPSTTIDAMQASLMGAHIEAGAIGADTVISRACLM